jgi:hypothetical protein
MAEVHGSVWYQEVDTALVNLVSSLINVKDDVGNLVPITTNLRIPEKEFEVEVYPSATINSYGEGFSQKRYDPNPVLVSVNEGTHTAYYEESAKPYSLFYQIDFWAHYIEDINFITLQWADFSRKFNVLSAIDNRGNTRTCNMILKGIVKADYTKDDIERIYHRIYNYEIQVEVDEGKQIAQKVVTQKVVTTVFVNNKTTL